MTSCSILNPKKPSTGGGGAGGGGGGGTAAAGGKGFSELFTDAPLYKLGQPVEVKAPPCSGNGFFKIDVEEGKPFYITTKALAGPSCAALEVVNANAQASGTSGDICTEEKTLTSKGQPGGTYVIIQERYGCAGIAVSMTTGEGTGPAAAAAPAAKSEGPTPEN